MNSQNLHPANKQSIDSISRELKESKEQGEKLKKALLEVFPVNLYKQVKELPETYNEDQKVIDHFVNHGIDEINFKEIIKENINYLNLDIPSNQYHHIKEAAKLITLELIESKSRDKERALKSSAGCLRDSGITDITMSNHHETEGGRVFLKTQGNPENLCKTRATNSGTHQSSLQEQ